MKKRLTLKYIASTLPTTQKKAFRCKKLVLASGALGSARIVLRSNSDTKTKLPLLCNPYRYIPCVQPKLMGRAAEPRKLGFTQLSLFYDKNMENKDVSVASLYSYQSLMLFRILRHVPLNFQDARRIFQFLVSGLVIMGIHHPDRQSPDKFLQLQKDTASPTGDRMYAQYKLDSESEDEHRIREKGFVSTMRKFGAHGLKSVNPGEGASIHYAGTIPFSDTEKPYTLASDGRLHTTSSVYVADSSGFTYLPAKGLTFSLLANAHCVADGLTK